jgi:hypothetical protein
VRDKVVRSTLCADLIRSFADHESLGLSEEIGSQHPTTVSTFLSTLLINLLLVLVVLHRIVALRRQNKIRRDKLGSLMQQLVERMLGISGGLAEENGPSGVLDVFTTSSDGLSVGLHGQLLEIGGESMKVLVEAVFSQ